MPDDTLLAETNRLLAKVLQIQEDRRAEGERALKEIEEQFSDTEGAMKKRLEERGLPPEGLEGTSGEWERRREAASRRSLENLETLRERDETYKVELLAELRTQSEILRQIAERLER